MDVMSLMAKIGLDSSDYDKGLDDASGKFSGFGQKIASGAKTIGKVGVAAFAAIGTAVTGATVSLVKNAGETAAYADNIDKMSQKMGFSAEKFQEWDFIMQHNGSSIEAVKSAMMKLNNSLESGSDAYGKLGLSIEQMQSMSAEDRFEATVAALQNVTDETERAALAQDIFGRSYQELGPLLNSSNEDIEEMKKQVHDLGGVMSDDAVKSGAAFQDSLQNLKTTMSGVKNNLMGEFLPSLTTVMDGLTALFSGDDSGIEKIKQGIEDFAKNLSEKLPKVVQLLGGIAESLISSLPQFFDVIAEQLPTLIETLIPVLIDAVVGLANAIVKALPKIMEAIQKNIKVISQGLTKILSAIGKIIMQLLPTLLPTLLKIGIELIKELAKGFIENASEVIRVIFELIDLIVTELTNPDTLMQLLECGLQIIIALAQGILENLPVLLGSLGTLISNIVTFLVEAIPQLVMEIGKNGAKIITDVIPNLLINIGEAGGELLGKIIETIGGWWKDIFDGASSVFSNIGGGLLDAWDYIKQKVGEFGELIWGGIKDVFKGMWDFGKELGTKIWEGIKSMWGKLKDALNPKNWFSAGSIMDSTDWAEKYGQKTAEGYVEGQREGFDINSPSKKMRWIGKMVMEGYSDGLEDESSDAFDAFADMNNRISRLNAPHIDFGTSTSGVYGTSGGSIGELVNAVKALMEQGREIIIPVHVGDKQIDELYVDSSQRIAVRSGGQVNV